jgi:tetratricopeptide (TPR) repeat protein
MSSNGSGQSQSLPSIIPGSYLDRIEEARWHMERREWDEAAAILQRIVDRINRLPEQRRRPGSNPALYRVVAAGELVTARSMLDDWEGAAELCRQLQDWDADDADFWRRHVHVLEVERGEIERGLEGLYAIATTEPDDFDHWITLAEESITHHQSKHVEEALAQAEMLAGQVELEDDLLTPQSLVHFWRFQFYGQQQRWHEAGEAWKRAVSFEPSLVDTQELVVRMLLEAGLLENAEGYLDEAVLGQATVHYYSGLIAHRRGDRVRARYLWRRAVAATEGDDGEDEPALRAMARCRLGEPRLALAELVEDYQTSRAFSVRIAIALALGWAMEGNLNAALANLDLAREGARLALQPRQLSALDWREFDELVPDHAIKEALRPYFETATPAAWTGPSHPGEDP